MADETIYLVRHGETEWNVEGRLQGQLDSPLTLRGKEQARAAGRFLRQSLDPRPVVIESSPRGRAVQTARLIAAEFGIDGKELCINDLLAEHHLGRWAGLTFDEADRLFPDERAARAADRWGYVVPGGESYAMLLLRAREWLGQSRLAPITIAVTHEMISRTIQGAYLGSDPPAILLGSHAQDRVYRLHAGAVDELAC